MLELAVLGLLHEIPMHGYELRKRLHGTLGVFRTLSYGTLYPTLRRMLRDGLIEEEPEAAACGWGRRTRRVYRLTEHGRCRFAELVGSCGPQACDDTAFGVHVAFFAHTPVDVRLRILRARRNRLEQRREGLRTALTHTDEQHDRYLLELQRLRLNHSDQEVRWLDDIIEHERAETGRDGPQAATGHQTRGQDT